MYPYQQYGSAPAGMGSLDMMGGLGGPSNRSANRRVQEFFTPPTGGVTPPPFEDSGPTTFSTRPMRMKNPAPTQSNEPEYAGGSRDFDESTGTYRSEDGRGPMMMSPAVMPKDFDGTTPTNQQQMQPEGVHGYPVNQQQMQRPMRGYGQQMQQMQRPMGGFGGFGQQMNPFMGGQGFNPMGGFGQQMNPFMGGGGFGGYSQQMNPFMGGGGFNPMGGGFGGFGQQMNPFMGGQGFNPMGGGFGGFGGFGQQMNPFMGGQGFNPMGGGFGQQMQQPMQQRSQPQQQQSPMAPMGYQGGAF